MRTAGIGDIFREYATHTVPELPFCLCYLSGIVRWAELLWNKQTPDHCRLPIGPLGSSKESDVASGARLNLAAVFNRPCTSLGSHP